MVVSLSVCLALLWLVEPCKAAKRHLSPVRVGRDIPLDMGRGSPDTDSPWDTRHLHHFDHGQGEFLLKLRHCTHRRNYLG